MAMISASARTEGRSGACDFMPKTACRPFGDGSSQCVVPTPPLFSPIDSASNHFGSGGPGADLAASGPCSFAGSYRSASVGNPTQPAIDLTRCWQAIPHAPVGVVRAPVRWSWDAGRALGGLPRIHTPASNGLGWMYPNHGDETRHGRAFSLGICSFNNRTYWP